MRCWENGSLGQQGLVQWWARSREVQKPTGSGQWVLAHGPFFAARSVLFLLLLRGRLSPRASLLKAQPPACSPSFFSLNIPWRFLIFFQGPIDYVAHILNVFLLWWFLRAIDPVGLFSDMLHFQCSCRGAPDEPSLPTPLLPSAVAQGPAEALSRQQVPICSVTSPVRWGTGS